MTEEIKLRSNRKNLTGQKFGKLTVIKPVKTINDTSRWLCKCECGNEKIVATYRLLSGRVKTCGDCFNTINFYIPEIKRLEQENKELKEKVKSRENELVNMSEQANMRINNYRSALEEIKEIARFNQFYNPEDLLINGDIGQVQNLKMTEIYDKIREVL
jgi:hypothetical protein